MHIAFIDVVESYTAERPDLPEAFGGTNTAVCFLARALAAAGVQCTFFNKIAKESKVLGIRSLPLEALTTERDNRDYSAFVFCGRWVQWLVDMIREKASGPLIAWMHESRFSGEFTAPLTSFAGVVFVSDWQAHANQSVLPTHFRQSVIRNAMNPAFASSFSEGRIFDPKNVETPIILYAGATPRGVIYLPSIIERLSGRRKDFSLEICCSGRLTRDEAVNALFREQLMGLPNVAHVGAVGQRELAQRMRRASIFLAPNLWPETSCITLIEALASGLTGVIAGRAALPETAAGYARIIDVEDADHVSRYDMPLPTEDFVQALDDALTICRNPLEAYERKLRTQVDYFTKHYQWSQRVSPWLDFIQSFGNTSAHR